MAVNIKDPDTDRLIRELVQRTGESQVTAVKTGVVERLERLTQRGGERRPSRKERLRAIARDTGPRLAHACASDEIGDLLYDEQGLPA